MTAHRNDKDMLGGSERAPFTRLGARWKIPSFYRRRCPLNPKAAVRPIRGTGGLQAGPSFHFLLLTFYFFLSPPLHIETLRPRFARYAIRATRKPPLLLPSYA